MNEIVAKKLYAGGYVRHSLIGKIKVCDHCEVCEKQSLQF